MAHCRAAVTSDSIRTMSIHNSRYMQDRRGQARVSGIIHRGYERNFLSAGEEGQKWVVQIEAGSNLPKSAHCVVFGDHHHGGVSTRIIISAGSQKHRGRLRVRKV